MEEIDEMVKKLEEEVKQLEDMNEDKNIENTSDHKKIIEEINDIMSVINVE